MTAGKGAGLTMGSADGDREAVIQRVLSLYTEGAAVPCAMKTSNVFGVVRREHNGALTVDSW